MLLNFIRIFFGKIIFTDKNFFQPKIFSIRNFFPNQNFFPTKIFFRPKFFSDQIFFLTKFFSATDSGCQNRGWVCSGENPWSCQHSIVRGIAYPCHWRWCIIHKVEFAFSLPEKKFTETFGISKPGMADLIITSCKVTLLSRYSLHLVSIWFAVSGDFGIGYWEYSNMGPATVELRAGAWYMWALFKYSKTEWGSAHKIEYLWKRFRSHARISIFKIIRVKKCPQSCLSHHLCLITVQQVVS